MLETNELIVLSDIHLGPENGKGLFRSDKELVNCINWILTQKKKCLVVFAGDIFDFLVLGDGETASDFNNLDKVELRMENIIESHSAVFDALAKLANSRQHDLFFIAGNHDPEVVFPEVQLLIEKRINKSSHSTIKWVVHGESLSIRVGETTILIEHGNLFDKFNRIDHKALREVLSIKNRGFSVNGKNYYTPPFGSQLVIDYVNPIRKDFPWLDYLHVGRKTVYPIWRELTTIKQKGAFLPALKGAILAKSQDELTKLKSLLNPQIRYKLDTEDNLLAWINKKLHNPAPNKSKGLVFKSEDSELINELISTWEDLSNINSPDLAYEDIAFLMQQKANLVIMGHTHQAKIYPVGNGLYINTGTWGQLLELPHKEDPVEKWTEFTLNLKAGSKWKDTSFSRPTFAYVRTNLSKAETFASLIEWKKNNPLDLSKWRWEPITNKWEAEV